MMVKANHVKCDNKDDHAAHWWAYEDEADDVQHYCFGRLATEKTIMKRPISGN